MVSYAWQEEFDYDDAGSRIQKRNGWGAIDYQYSDENRLRLAGKREYTHDKNGNLIQESSGGGLRRYEYNSQNRISQAIMNEGMARLLEYTYDGLGRRTEMSDSLSGTTRYGYEGLGLNPVEEDFERRFNIRSSLEEHHNNFKQGETQPRESRGRGRYMPYPQDSDRRTSKKTPSRGLAFSVSETRSYLYKGLSPVASTAVGDKGGMRSEAYGHDALGSVTEVVQYGMLQASYRYDAFGKTYEGALSSGERGYNGKPYNAVTGHYNYGYRDYDPMTGRFATVDPIRDGMNWYVYTANDPVNYIDPWGLAAEDKGSKGFTVQLGLSGTIGAGTGVTAGGGIVFGIQFDRTTGPTVDKGFYTVGGTGALAGRTASVGVDISFSTNDKKEDLEDQAVTIGGSVNIVAPVSAGIEANIPTTGDADPSFTGSATVGFGTPGEGHIFVTDTVVNDTFAGVITETYDKWFGK